MCLSTCAVFRFHRRLWFSKNKKPKIRRYFCFETVGAIEPIYNYRARKRFVRETDGFATTRVSNVHKHRVKTARYFFVRARGFKHSGVFNSITRNKRAVCLYLFYHRSYIYIYV